MKKSSQVRVKRKGQITIPIELRLKLGIEEGAIMLKPTPRLAAGKAVGEEEYKQIIRELDQLRRKWR